MTETSQTDAEKLNPKCRKVEVGIRHLHEIILYPVSAAGFLKMKEALKKIFNTFEIVANAQSAEGYSTLQKNYFTADKLADAIQENAEILLTEATCGDIPGGDLLKDMDAEQTVTVLDIIAEMNFMSLKDTVPLVGKKWMGVFTKAHNPTEEKQSDGKSV